jgi:hypothetical protein
MADHLKVMDTVGLNDADWSEIAKLERAYDTGGHKALAKALQELSVNTIRYMRVMCALFPDYVRQTIKDRMAERGLTAADLQRALRQLDEGNSTIH